SGTGLEATTVRARAAGGWAGWTPARQAARRHAIICFARRRCASDKPYRTARLVVRLAGQARADYRSRLDLTLSTRSDSEARICPDSQAAARDRLRHWLTILLDAWGLNASNFEVGPSTLSIHGPL